VDHVMTSRPGRRARLLTMALVLILPWMAHGRTSDDFSTPLIDLTKWQDVNSDTVRRLTGGKFESSVTKFGLPRNANVNFADPGTVQSIQTKVTVTDATLVSPSGSGLTNLRARILGAFYNNGAVGAGSIGDIVARIELRVDALAPPGMARVIMAVDRCDAADCSVGPSLFFDSSTFGPVPIGSEHTLGVAWDGNQTFTFTFDAGVPQVYVASEPNAGPAKDPFKFIGTNARGVDGTEGGSIRALFDDVSKNGVLYEDFQGVTLSGTKWLTPQEFVRRNRNGVFESAQGRSASGGHNLLLLQQADVTTLSVDVTVTEVRRPNNPGTRLSARLIGAFYNDGTPGGGESGDVIAIVQISDLEDGSGLQGVFAVSRCLVPDCSLDTVLIDDVTTFPAVGLGTRHRLFLSFDGTTFTFGIDDARATFTPGPAFPNVGPPLVPLKGIGTRVAAAGTGGFISADFDNFVAIGGLSLAIRGTDNGIYHNRFDGVAWSGYTGLPGATADIPALASSGGGVLDLVVRGTDNGIYHNHYDGATWSGWTALPGATASIPALAASGGGVLDLVVRGTDNGIYHNHYDGTTWSGWVALPGATADIPALAAGGGGVLDLVVRGTDNGVYWNHYDGTTWSGWVALPGATADIPALAASGGGVLDLVVRGTDNGVYWNHYDGATWSGWTALPGATASIPALAASGGGVLDLVVRGLDNSVYHNHYDGTTWSGWTALPGATADVPALVARGGGLLDLVVRGSDNGVYHNHYNGTAWSGWTTVGGATASRPALVVE
jgi:hypothetical protein